MYFKKKKGGIEMTLVGILVLGFAAYGVITWLSRGKDGGRHSRR